MAMTAVITFATRNYIATATLSTNVAMLTPLSRLARPLRGQRSQFAAITNVQVTALLPTLEQANAVVLGDTNLTAQATVEVHASTDGFVTDDRLVGVLTMGEDPAPLYQTLWCDPPVAARAWRLVCSDPTNPDSVLEIGHWAVVPTVHVGSNSTPPLTLQVIDDSRAQRAVTGALWIDPRGQWRAATITFGPLPASLAIGVLLDLARQSALSTPLWLFVFPPGGGWGSAVERRMTLYGVLRAVGDFTLLPGGAVDPGALEFEEY